MPAPLSILRSLPDVKVDNFGFGMEMRRKLEMEVMKGNMAFR